jgi:hypothetical protein
MDLRAYLHDAEAFSQALNREYYLHFAGLKDELELTPIYDLYGSLFTTDAYEEIAETELDPKQKHFIRAFIAENFIDAQVKRHTEQLARAEAAATLEWASETLTYRAAPVRLANLGSQDRRHSLDEVWRQATQELNRVRAERHAAVVSQAPKLDYKDYVVLWDDLRGLNLAGLAEQSQRLLDETEKMFRDELQIQLVHAGVDPSGAWKADLAWVFRAPQFDKFFDADRLLLTLRRTLAGLGLRLEEQPNVKLDVEFRDKKRPRAFCAPVEIPDDVRLVLMPTGGRTDYATLLHEAGHAEHFANVDRSQPFAFKWLGDNSLTEAYAFLLEYLTTEPKWLAEHLQVTTLTDYLRVFLFQKLYMLRRYATKVVWEPQLHRQPEDQDMAERYAELFTQRLGVQYFPEEYLSDLDDAFYAAQYLRAWTLEGQLRLYLKREFDEEWYRHPRAGRFLVELWREGQKYTAEELVRNMGYDGLDFAPMLAEIKGALAG